MKTWNQLFIRHGWNLREKETNVFDCRQETEGNMDFLRECFKKFGVIYNLENESLAVKSEPVEEWRWMKELDIPNREGVHGLHLVEAEPRIRGLNIFISGVLRQFNRLGFHTVGFNSWRGRGPAYVMVPRETDMKLLKEILLTLGVARIRYRTLQDAHRVYLHLPEHELLDLAEKMGVIEPEWLEKGIAYVQEQRFYSKLEELLTIPGESGNEGRAREVAKEMLGPFVDNISTDRYGNLLAEKQYKSGNGPTVLLNAHLDTVEEIEKDRTINRNGTVWSSSEGILGADDRAGVAVLVHIAESLMHSSFSGRVKYIFTVEEECGLIGAQQVDEYFLWDVDAAIVVDRRGKGDIITSYSRFIPFCDEAYGSFFEKVALQEGLTGWACTNGGSSDTRIWAERGIDSVNLSVGYWNEHTSEESLDVKAAYGTVQLVEGVFENGRELRRVLRQIERRERREESIDLREPAVILSTD